MGIPICVPVLFLLLLLVFMFIFMAVLLILMGLSYIRLRSLLVSRGREWIAARHCECTVGTPKHSSSQRQGERQDPVKGGVPHCHCCTMSPHSTPLLAHSPRSTFALFRLSPEFKLNLAPMFQTPSSSSSSSFSSSSNCAIISPPPAYASI